MSKKSLSYLGLFFVVFIWGCNPLIMLEMYKYYSPTIRLCFFELILLISYLIFSHKHIRKFNIDYIKVGIPTGIFLAFANITQKIGLLYTTPTKFAFLENLSCITVPIVMYFITKKKPGFMTVLSCFVCMVGIMILSGVTLTDASSWGIGETLCAIAGLLFGFNIAGTSVYAKKLYAPLYLAVQSSVGFLMSLVFSLILNFTTVTSSNGSVAPIEKIVFSFRIEHILFLIAAAVITNALCWIIRTNAMKHVEASIVAIIMPFSSVVTGVVSVISGNDILNSNLIWGGILGIISIFISCYDDIFKRKT